MTEALPIGNGPMGAMLFGGTDLERIQFNEISLWSGDRMPRPEDGDEGRIGAHQAFGDIFIRLGHDPAEIRNYRRQLDIDRAVHTVEYEYRGVRYQQTAFASHPAGVIVYELTADKPAAITGHVWLTDAHDADISLKGNRFRAVGRMPNGFEYEAQLQVSSQGGELKPAKRENPYRIPLGMPALGFNQCDSLTLVLGAGTSFVQDISKQWLGEHPRAAITRRVDAAAARSVAELLGEHVKDYRSLFRRFSIELGRPAGRPSSKTTRERLEALHPGQGT